MVMVLGTSSSDNVSILAGGLTLWAINILIKHWQSYGIGGCFFVAEG